MSTDPKPEEFVDIEVDGKPVKAVKGENIIRATDREGIYIPRFCYHDKLPVAANCRMCLVEVEKAPKPLPACATPVAPGMKLFTKSPKAIGAQRAVMEFLLINHPLDCPICDQGGECELQDLAMGFGRDISRFVERKRVVKDKNLGPLVSTDMTRCIHCTRCVRFGADIAGIQEMGATGRGEHMEIGTYIERSVDHELSGNIIDLCPVGALNSKPFRYRGRGWEMTQFPLVSPHDGLGTNIYGHVLRGKLMRVVPRPCEDINETWIADRDRYSYEGIYSADRLAKPQVRQSDGTWREVEWDAALAAAADGLKAANGGKGGVGVLAHPSSTLEELYLLSRLAEGLGTSNIDHRLRQRDFRDAAGDPLAPSLGLPIADVDRLESLLVIGSHLRHELPLLAHRVRKAALKGAKVSFINPRRFDYLFPVSQYVLSDAGGDITELAAVLRAALGDTAAPAGVADLVGRAEPTDAHRAIADSLKSGERRAIWLGALALRSARYSELRLLARALASATGSAFGELAEGGNAAGAALAGVLPHRTAGGSPRPTAGLTARQMLEQPLAGYLLLNCEPWSDAVRPQALEVLQKAHCIVAVTAFASEEMKRVAHVLLPAGVFAETSGTYVNLEGRWQSQSGAARPFGASRPAWKILRVLGNQLELPNFEYQSSEQIRDELKGHLESAPQPMFREPPALQPGPSEPVIDVPMYQIDPVLRRAVALARTHDGRLPTVSYGGAA
ncbi:MAG TPA: NADH-quinone oxidoreductase subunit NuoG [Steroidobacteraceae bacterium]|jgi:NADH-quinone oxidoreductase subunit G|nr:NADH-quinone oxidoreductase subunit NuoG [Steroidobacteraceae bacterium]